MLLASTTDVAHWRSPFCAGVDRALDTCGFGRVELPWDTFQVLQRDRDHFTKRGFDAFRQALAAELARRDVVGDVLVIADSTIDYLNDASRSADAAVCRALRARGMVPRVLSEGGSGFCARGHAGHDFSELASGVLRGADGARWRGATWVVIGGWNDERCGLAAASRGIERLRALKRHV